jgi:hypothetical protein
MIVFATLAVCNFAGCEQEIAHEREVDVDDDGTVETKEKTVTRDSDGTTTVTEEKTETRP